MAALRPAAAPSPVWGRRLTEWGVLLALILVVMGIGYAQTQRLRGQAELARLQSSLGALRTALVVAHLERAVKAQQTAQLQAGQAEGAAAVDAPALPPVSRNPFLALAQLPPNYLGESTPLALVDLPGGNWVFDAACQCIGYKPPETGWLEAPADAIALWFQVSAPPGPLQITAQRHYVWLGQKVE
ncbi:MAG: hypothetical protein U5M53_11555 [Rhodoferax sp.]|nr:hypothetical protein [Rhodoferax sp.]